MRIEKIFIRQSCFLVCWLLLKRFIPNNFIELMQIYHSLLVRVNMNT